MRIPLDYYRILGLPTQATAEQVQQAHRDRVLQLPRREYSEPAIAARRELLDEAYSILSDEEERAKYDTHFLQQTANLAGNLSGSSGDERNSSPASQTPHIDIEDHQLIGAMLLLQELGEYELVLKLGEDCLAQSKSHKANAADLDLIAADVALTVALAHLELGREQWQQSHYEDAAASLEAGQDLLLREGLFAGVRGEVRSDLYRLRPYRVLELVSQPLEQSEKREKGIKILQDMLQERTGIDGHGDDQSGLDVDDFLRFVQQLRDYLTVEEQQELFEAEARRPSAVASYLAVYALISRGFAHNQPALIRRAKTLLSGLSQRQDVHLEQSVCALMLGQTEEASRVLEFSQEFESLAFIREHSQGSPDLLPGLCLYAERWLQDEVFPNFRDLKGEEATLKAYFADPEVQTYLEALPVETVSDEWEAMPNPELQTAQQSRIYAQESPSLVASENAYESASYGEPATSTATLEAPASSAATSSGQNGRGAIAAGAAGIAGAAASIATFGRNAGEQETNGHHPDSEARPRRRRPRRNRGGAVYGNGGSRRERAAGAKASSLRIDRLLLLAGGALLGLLLLFFLISRLVAWISGSGGNQSTGASSNNGTTQVTKLEKGQLSIGLSEPVLEIFRDVGAVQEVTASGALNEATAKQVIDLWLRTKADVFGEKSQAEKLPNVLSGSALSSWQEEAELSKQDGITVKYEHELTIDEVITGEDPNQAEVLATVKEVATYYQAGSKLNTRDDPALLLRYNLLQEDGSWKIQSMGVR